MIGSPGRNRWPSRSMARLSLTMRTSSCRRPSMALYWGSWAEVRAAPHRAAPHLAKGELIGVMDDWTAPFPGSFLYLSPSQAAACYACGCDRNVPSVELIRLLVKYSEG